MPAAEGLRTTTVRRNGTVRARRIEFLIGRQHSGQTAYILYHARTLEFFDHHGTFIAEADWPAPEITYVSTDQLRQRPTTDDPVQSTTVTDVLNADATVTDVLRHDASATDVLRHHIPTLRSMGNLHRSGEVSPSAG